MMSLDVTALFTNVPLDFVLENLQEAASDNIFSPPIPIDHFCQLIRICVSATIFEYDGNIYKQKFGVAMGSPLSPILANLCMEFFEKRYIETLPEDIKPKFWVRYVDDIFIIFQGDDEQLNNLLDTVNSLLPSIKFTIEHEDGGTLPFLDVHVIHDSTTSSFSFKVYRKTTNKENYIHFFSCHSHKVKVNVVTNMFSRAYRICDPLHLDDEIKHIKAAFLKLAYPTHFINRCLKNARSKWHNPQPKKEKEIVKNITLPYSPDLENTQREIKKLTNQCSSNKDKVDLTFSYNNTIRNRLVRNSSRSKKVDVGVYCIPCKDCNQCYIGETGRGLDIRVAEHKRACRLGYHYNAISSHTWTKGHRIGFDNSSIIYKNNNLCTRKLVEGALISLNNTFTNNKGMTNEDIFTNISICKSINIKDFMSVAATLFPAASPLSPQVNTVPQVAGTRVTGAYAAEDVAAQPPEPPDEGPPNNRNCHSQLRRSLRLRQRL